ncbi:MAG: 3-deoxy-D-manno-octulosonic acid transferase [Candidatus Liberibacter ctenarytainae]|uniref:3-deoxy-D-manno-octulosonic acid transferase n=1 Tax=Candidatus Liberibacter ctenarytainae TaxID=2020335 RepID=A0A937DLN0_9HYPH|nr:3-deoxy-D-manno-octulosonic acid transferase [Candidatus Liberibacter ctenarytainae]
MNINLSHVLLRVYRWGGIFLTPFLSVFLHFQKLLDKKGSKRVLEKLGYPSVLRPIGPLIWFHAVSVGETIALIELIREMRHRNINVLLTTKTATSARIAQNRLGKEAIHQYASFDTHNALSRFLQYWRPDCAIFSESEIWPLTVVELSKRYIPQILVNARMSNRSFKNWRIYQDFSENFFGKFSLVVAQSEEDCRRYRELGVRQLIVSGNLKIDVESPPCNEEILHVYRKQIAKRYTWAAISTFEGEEDAAVNVHESLCLHKNLLTILVPRHPERCDSIEKKLLARGLKVARRTRGDILSPDVDIFLGDTIGEIGLYLRMTEIAFVGRSLCASGGQNPLEPAMLGCAILSGPNVENFSYIYQQMASAGAAYIVQDIEKLSKSVNVLLSKPEIRYKMINTAMAKVKEMRGALEITLRALDPYVNPLVLQSRLLSKERQM